MNLNVDYSKVYDDEKCKMHSEIFPNNIFMIIAGSTGCGKTNLMLNFLLGNVLHYNNVTLYTTTPYQKAYGFLNDFYNELKRTFKIPYEIITFYNANDEILDPAQLDSSKTHVVIFDDVMNEDQKVITDYFCRGRHNNVNVFYLCQSYHHLKKHGIRQNANIVVLFEQDEKTLKYFYETHISGDMSFEEFKKFCRDAWSKEHGYAVINLWEKPNFGRYVKNYATVFIPDKYLKIPNNT